LQVLKLAGLVLLVALILVGALMPLKYTARLHLPKRPVGGGKRQDGDHAASSETGSRDE
jgi:hypothetical protein